MVQDQSKRFKSGLGFGLHFESMWEPVNSSDLSKLAAGVTIHCKTNIFLGRGIGARGDMFNIHTIRGCV